jgi:hypothetical protein
MANQFTSGGGSKGPKKEHDQATKDKIRAELLAKRMYKFARAKGKSADKYRMDSAQVAAAKVLIDKGKPSLQAIEQTEVNQWDRMSEDEMLSMVNALITSNPGLIQKLGIGLRPVEAPQQTDIPAPSDTKDAA